MGGNNYEKEHLSKDKLIKEGNFPDVLSVDDDLVLASMDYLSELTYT